MPDWDKIIRVTYTNWRGETSDRRIQIKDIRYGSTEWHQEPQWLLIALDLDKGVDREFALKDMRSVPDATAREEADTGA